MVTVNTSGEVGAPLQRVWDLVSDFAALKRWHPAVVTCRTEGTGVGAVRRVEFADWSAAERLEALDPVSHALSYRVIESSRPAVIGASGTMTLSAVDAERTRVEWVTTVDAPPESAAGLQAMLSSYYRSRIGDLENALKR